MRLQKRRWILPLVFGSLIVLSWAAQSSALPILQITKVDDVDPVVAGENVTYTITIQNTGDQRADNVTVDDILPSGFSVVSVSSSAGGCTALPCNLGDMNSGGPTSIQTVTLVASVAPGTAAGTYADTATVDSDDTEPVSTIENTTVTESATLQITKTDSPDPVAAGGNLTYTIVVTNSGPSNADLVTVTDALPPEVTFVSATATAPDPGASCSGGATVTCDLGTLTTTGPNNTATVTVVVNVSPTAQGSSISNSATVDSAEPEAPVTSSAATTSVTTSADLSVEKIDSEDPVQPGSQFEYTVTVTNTGPSDAQSVRMEDNLPNGFTVVSVSGPGSCTNTASSVLCSIPSLGAVAPTNVAVWTITVQVGSLGGPITDGAVLTNTARVSSSTGDPTSGDANTDSETTTVAAPSVTLEKTADPPSGSEVGSGQTITYTITYTNTGSGSLTNFVINDPVSTFLSNVVPADGGVYDPDTRTVTWIIGDVPPGGLGSVSFSAQVGSSSGRESILNRANAISAEMSEPVVSNRTDHNLIPPDVTMNKSANRPENSVVKPGDVITYQLDVRNRGPNTSGVVITDSPPPHMVYVPGSTRLDGSPVSDVGGTSPLFAGGIAFDMDRNDRRTITFQMVISITAPAGSVLENWAYATSGGGQFVSGDFFDLRVFKPSTGPTLRQSVLVQTAEGETIFVSVYNTVVGLLPVTGYQLAVLAFLGLSSIGLGRSFASRISSDLLRRKNEDE